MSHKLLSRESFRESVFERDDKNCVVCGAPAVDAHHILERRLWSDGGYYIDNGASVCSKCHMDCETTEISVETLRILCGITKPILPEHMYYDNIYDKWGNIVLPNGNRLKGELYHRDTVQKVLSHLEPIFIDQVKYPRTYHIPWSEGMNKDDRMLANCDYFVGKRVIVTEKMDGENTSIYPDSTTHARSIDSISHYSQSWVKNFASAIAYAIPDGWRVCGENLFAKHSIGYDNLEAYFYGFSIWNEQNNCMHWEETELYFDLLGIKCVPVLYDGIYDEEKIKSCWEESRREQSEGYVMRIADSFHYSEFRKCVAKFVRKNHVDSNAHWRYGKPITENKLK